MGRMCSQPTDTDANGTSAASSPFNVTVIVPAAPRRRLAPNLVTNGGFETGDFTGWTIGNFQSYQTFITAAAHTGQFAADLGTVGGEGSLSQVVQNLVVGQQYVLDFWLANVGGTPNNFQALVGGQTLYSESNAGSEPYTEHTVTFTATATNETLQFTYRQDPSDWHLDDVSVHLVGIASA